MSAVNNSTNQIYQPAYSGNPAQNPPQAILNFNQHVQGREVAVNQPWHERAVAHLDNCKRKLDEKVPNSIIQNKIDALGREIENKFAPLKKFNDWLNKNEMGSWYKQLAMFLVKLPMKAVRNIVRLLYSIIKGVFYTAVHPLKAGVKLAKLLVRLGHELTKPETLSKIGAGIMGASAGQALVTANPFALIGVGIGGAMVVGGISWGMLKAYFAAQGQQAGRTAALENLLYQAKQLPEAALTGFCIGLLFGAIQRTMVVSNEMPPGWENVKPANPNPEMACHFWDEECIAAALPGCGCANPIPANPEMACAFWDVECLLAAQG